MDPHSNKGRAIVAEAILYSVDCSDELKTIALKCILAYQEETDTKLTP